MSLPEGMPDDLLESWKEIASYLGKGVRTVVRWEKTESLPIHRHLHERRSSVFAYKSEIDAWWQTRRALLDPQPFPPPQRQVRSLGFAVLIPIVAMTVWLLWPTAVRTRGIPVTVEPLTSYPGAQYAPSFSPDGNHFAFAWNPVGQDNTDLYVQAIGSADPKRLTDHPDMEFSPAWSPDGKWIAYLRRSRQYRIELLLIPSTGGVEHKLADLKVALYMDATQLSWSPDGKWLAFADGERDAFGIFSLAPETGERRRLTKGYGPRGDLDPAFSPDGRHLAFRRGENESQAEIYMQTLTSDGRPEGDPDKLTDRGVRSTSPVWSADGRRIFFSSGIFNSTVNDLYRLQVRPRTSEPPERLTSSSGDAHFSLATSWRGGLLAYTRRQIDLNIWVVERNGQGWKAPQPVQLLSSVRNEQDPALSPDGRQIAFVSDRSGHQELWIAQRDGSQARRITFFDGAYTGSPRWSPDSRQITFTVLTRDAYSIWLVVAAGGSPRRLVEAGCSSSWSRDGRWIYYSTPTHQSPRIFKVPAEGGAPLQVVGIAPTETSSSSDNMADSPRVIQRGNEPGNMPVESPDGRFLFFKERDGVWRLPTAGGRAELMVKINWYTPYVVCDAGLFFNGPADPGTSRRSLLHYRFGDGATEEVVAPGPRPPLGLAASPDCNTMLYSQMDQEQTNLMFVRGVW